MRKISYAIFGLFTKALANLGESIYVIFEAFAKTMQTDTDENIIFGSC